VAAKQCTICSISYNMSRILQLEATCIVFTIVCACDTTGTSNTAAEALSTNESFAALMLRPVLWGNG